MSCGWCERRGRRRRHDRPHLDAADSHTDGGRLRRCLRANHAPPFRCRPNCCRSGGDVRTNVQQRGRLLRAARRRLLWKQSADCPSRFGRLLGRLPQALESRTRAELLLSGDGPWRHAGLMLSRQRAAGLEWLQTDAPRLPRNLRIPPAPKESVPRCLRRLWFGVAVRCRLRPQSRWKEAWPLSPICECTPHRAWQLAARRCSLLWRDHGRRRRTCG